MTEAREGSRSRNDASTSAPAAWLAWLWGRRFAVIYIALGMMFVVQIMRLRDAQTGFTRLVFFGDYFEPYRLTKLADIPIYTYGHSTGYDGQFYAQVAVAGNPFDRELRTALDSPAYRSGRILVPVLAYLAGLGHPAWVLNAYALSNVLCWLLLAWMTARWWFQPTSLDNLARWMGTLFGAGMLTSVTRSLTDGPALLVMAIGVRCLEKNRCRLAAGVLGAAGLAREMSILAVTAFLPPIRSEKTVWRRAILSGAACVLPAILWAAILSAHYGAISKGGIGTLSIPFVSFVHECRLLGSMVRGGHWLVAQDRVYVAVAFAVQVAFVLGHPRPALAWWRIGAVYSFVALLLGPLAWDDPITAVTRHVLPLALAFNVLVPRTRQGLVVLLLGNLTVLSAPGILSSLPRDQTAFDLGITVDYASGWHDPEHRWTRAWRWSSGSAALKFHNPTERAARVSLEFELSTPTARTITLHTTDARQVVSLHTTRRVPVHFGPFDLPPGDTVLEFDTDDPPWIEPGPHGRALSFSLQNLGLTAR